MSDAYNRLHQLIDGLCLDPDEREDAKDDVHEAVEAALREAQRLQRERCAKVCEERSTKWREWPRGHNMVANVENGGRMLEAEHLAELIRNAGQKGGE